MNNTPEGTFDYEVTEGGVLIYFGPEDGLDLTSPSDNPLHQLANIERVTALLQAPWRYADEILATSPAEDQRKTSPAEDQRKLTLLHQVSQHAPAILKELAKLAAEIGEPCGVCGGDGGQEIGYGPIQWADCGACGGNRVQEVAA